MPGMNPAMNNWMMDTPVMLPYMTKAMEGGTHRPDGRRGGGDGGAELAVVTIFGHRLHFDQAEAGGIGHRGARHTRKDHAGDHVDVAEPAAEMADQRAREIEHALGDAAVVHQVSGQDEEGDGEQGEPRGRHVHALGHHRQDERVTERDEGSGGGQAHGREDRHSEHDQADQHDEDGQCQHVPLSIPNRVGSDPPSDRKPDHLVSSTIFRNFATFSLPEYSAIAS